MGKASKQRDCPAIGGIITPAECGEGRNCRYQCPAGCPHNPWAPRNYDQLLAIEDVLDPATFRWSVDGDPGRDRSFPERLRRETASDRTQGMHAAVVRHLYFETDASGLTSAQRWERAGFPGLNNDQRALFRAKMRMRVVLLEFRRVIDHERVEAIDLLAPEIPPFELLDRSLASRAVRFGNLLGWGFPLPHFWRLSGTALDIPELGSFTAREVLEATVRHLGGPSEEDARGRWLAGNFVKVVKSITDTAMERKRRTFAGMDAFWGNAVYVLKAPVAECRAVLDGEAAVERTPVEPAERKEGITEARAWFDDSREARTRALNVGRPMLGAILMKPGSWRLEASSADRLDRLRNIFEQRMGQRVAFDRERRDNLAANLVKDLPPPSDPALITPELLEGISSPVLSISQLPLPKGQSPTELKAMVQKGQLEGFADEPIPLLDNRTPREAARDPVLRPRLIGLMKSRIRSFDEENLRGGPAVDISPLLRELALPEIDFPPPPRRETPPDDDIDAEGDEDDYGEDEAPFVPGWPALPPLPANRPLTYDEAGDYFTAAMGSFDTAGEALDLMAAAGSTLVDDLLQETAGLIDEKDFAYVVPLLIPTWFVLVPQGTPEPLISREELRRALDRDLGEINTTLKSGTPLRPEHILKDHRQPDLAGFVATQALQSFGKMPKNSRLKPEDQAVIGLVLNTVINELDRAVRG